MSPRQTLVNILAAASVGSECVSAGGAGAVEAAGCVVTAVGADVSTSGQRTLIDIFTGDAVSIAQLVTTATVALVRAVDVRALLTTGAALTFIHIVTVSAVVRQLESSGAAALVGAQDVFTLVCTETTRIIPALVNVLAGSADAVEDEAGPALAAVRAHQINTAVSIAGVIRPCALVNIYTASALSVQMVSASTSDRVSLTDE